MKIILIGACGRMGRAVAELGGENIVAGVDCKPAEMPFPVYASLEEIAAPADAVIDFSSADGICERLNWCEKHGVPAVLAATGYSEADLHCIDRAARKIALFKTGNLSVGIALLQYLAEKAASFLGEGYEAEIIERHHNQKKDAPSGTALMLADSLEKGFGTAKQRVYGRQGLTGARNRAEIGIHAVRGGNIVGEHEIMFAGEDEIITVSHSARSRRVFATGALRAAEWLIGKPAGLYAMQDLVKSLL